MKVEKVIYYSSENGVSPVLKYIESLDENTKELIYNSINTFVKEFPEVKTVKIKHMRDKFWKIKLADRFKRNHRIVYVVINNTIIILHAFQKRNAKHPPVTKMGVPGRLNDIIGRLSL
ncbi:MAG: type II toxin-antitoxin system RelE/ParE family toxin [bacterium]